APPDLPPFPTRRPSDLAPSSASPTAPAATSLTAPAAISPTASPAPGSTAPAARGYHALIGMGDRGVLLVGGSTAIPRLRGKALRSEEHTSELQSPCNLV